MNPRAPAVGGPPSSRRAGTGNVIRATVSADSARSDDDGAPPPLTPAERAALEREKARVHQRVLARLTAASLVPEPQEAVPTGAQIAARRYERNLSQRDLAAAAGVSRGLVAEIERGRRTHWVSRWRLAEKLGMMAAASVGGGS